MRAVSRRRKLRKNISVGITVICLFAAGCLALLLTPVFSVDSVTVTGNTTISTDTIVQGSGIVRGTNIFGVSLSAVRDKLSLMNGIDTVKVRRSLPSTIRITVTEGNPLVYVENNGDFVGITVDGKVVDVVSAGTIEALTLTVQPNERTDTEEETEEEISTPRTYGKTVVYGMGEMEYTNGKIIKFADSLKGEKLMLLMSGFLSDDISQGFTQADMSVYDSITLLYRGRLTVRLGSAERLEYKLKCFKTIVGESLGEDSEGTLDLERLIYSPKKAGDKKEDKEE